MTARTMRIAFPLLAATLLGACSDSCQKHLKYGLPSEVDQVVCRESYAAGISHHYRNPVWVAAYLTPETIAARPDREYEIKRDDDLNERYRPEMRDYRGTAYVPGRVAYNNGSLDAGHYRQTYQWANTAPQLPAFGRGPWQAVADYERQLVSKHGEVFVISGPLFEGVNRNIGRREVAVPSHYYKVYYLPDTGDMGALLVPHRPGKVKDLSNYVVAVDDLEGMSGLDFFHKVLNVDEDVAEASAELLD